MYASPMVLIFSSPCLSASASNPEKILFSMVKIWLGARPSAMWVELTMSANMTGTSAQQAVRLFQFRLVSVPLLRGVLQQEVADAGNGDEVQREEHDAHVQRHLGDGHDAAGKLVVDEAADHQNDHV